jgi:hypothetical protein
MGKISPTGIRWFLLHTLGSVLVIFASGALIWFGDKISEAGDLTH